MRARALLVVPVVAWALARALPAGAVMGDAVAIGSNTFTTATLEAPSGPGATPACNGPTPKVDLAWTATPSTFADGYDVYRATVSGGPYTSIAHVTGRTTVTYADVTGLLVNTTYFYVLQATASSWTSVNSAQAQATTPLLCP